MAKNAPGDGQGKVRLVMDTSFDMVDDPLEASHRAAKGDLSMTVIKDFEPRPLSKPGLPFKIISE